MNNDKPIQPSPCPFCGKQPRKLHYPTLFVIECVDCKIRMSGEGQYARCPMGVKYEDFHPERYYADDVIEKWNKRAPVDSKPSEENKWAKLASQFKSELDNQDEEIEKLKAQLTKVKEVLKYLQTCNNDTAVRFSSPMPAHVLEEADKALSSEPITIATAIIPAGMYKVGELIDLSKHVFKLNVKPGDVEEPKCEPSAEMCLEWLANKNVTLQKTEDGYRVFIYDYYLTEAHKTLLEAIREAISKDIKL